MYAVNIAALSVISGLMHLHAARGGLLPPSCTLEPPTWRAAAVPVAFVVFIPIASLSTTAALLLWSAMRLQPHRWRARRGPALRHH